MESENQILPVDETQTSTELDIASRINALHAKTEALSKVAKKNAQEAIIVAIECGKLLVEQKSKMSHGDWMPWVDEHCNFSHRTATNYVNLFLSVNNGDGSNWQPVSNLTENETVENLNAGKTPTEIFLEKLPAKTLKDAYIATGIIPPRKKPELKQDDTPQTYKVEHVKFIDDFVKWYNDFKEKYPPEEMTESTVDALLLDLSAVVRIYQELAAIKKSRFHD